MQAMRIATLAAHHNSLPHSQICTDKASAIFLQNEKHGAQHRCRQSCKLL